jgi:P27 family predicted phage terminase small subunit
VPLEIQRLKGTLRGDRTPKVAARFPKASAEAPSWLKGDALETWNAIAPSLRSQGLLRRPDVPLFAALCVTMARVMALEKKTDRVGLDRAIAKGYRKAAVQERGILRALVSEFGMSPAARARVEADPPAPRRSLDKWAGLIKDDPLETIRQRARQARAGLPQSTGAPA